MHFHLPKPMHGWREFTGEVGIIVVGVLLALGAEQVVETVHWNERARHSRLALAEELEGHYGQSVEWRMIEPCVAAQLDRLENGLLKSGDRIIPAPIFREDDRIFALRAPSRPYPDSVWQGILAEGISSHLTDKERFYLGTHYRQVRDLDDLDKHFTETATRLYSLTRPIALDATSRLSLLQSIDEMRDANRWMGIIAGQLVGDIGLLHMVPPRGEIRDYVATSGTVKFCRTRHLPLRSFADATKPVAS